MLYYSEITEILPLLLLTLTGPIASSRLFPDFHTTTIITSNTSTTKLEDEDAQRVYLLLAT
jgi:hypothetical protein